MWKSDAANEARSESTEQGARSGSGGSGAIATDKRAVAA
jgi:hypothetical protein